MLKAIPVRDHAILRSFKYGKLLIFELDELPILGKGKGNKIINIPKDKLSAGEEFMAHAQLLAIDSSLKIEVGKRSNLKPKIGQNILSGQKGKESEVNIERLTEEIKSKKKIHNFKIKVV